MNGQRDEPTRIPTSVKRDFPLARLSTVRTGGPAEYFARAGSEEELGELLSWAGAIGAGVSVVGSGSNLLIADEGVAVMAGPVLGPVVGAVLAGLLVRAAQL